MASKDLEKKEKKEKKKNKKSKESNMIKDENKTVGRKEENNGNAFKTGENYTGEETGHSWGSQKPPISGPGSRTVRVKTNRNRKSYSEDSNGNFLSSMNFNKNHLLGIAGLVAGGALLYKGAKGAWPFLKKESEEVTLHTRQTIRRSREELYAYWRNLENLPNFMSHIKEINELDDRRSRWTAKVPGGLGTIEWEAVIEQEHENEYISWRSIADADIENSGEVRFKDAPTGQGTIVETTISYRPPAGKTGEYISKLFNPSFEKTVKADLGQFKKHMEEGSEEKRRSEPAEKTLY